jgi:hypothetical protein
MTEHQAAAVGHLRAVAGPHRFRVVKDPEGFPMIPGRLGTIEYHDGQSLAIYSDRPRLFARLWALPGLRRWQVGDQEARGLFPMESLPSVAALIRARRRRPGSPAAALRMRERALARATSAA